MCGAVAPEDLVDPCEWGHDVEGGRGRCGLRGKVRHRDYSAVLPFLWAIGGRFIALKRDAGEGGEFAVGDPVSMANETAGATDRTVRARY